MSFSIGTHVKVRPFSDSDETFYGIVEESFGNGKYLVARFDSKTVNGEKIYATVAVARAVFKQHKDGTFRLNGSGKIGPILHELSTEQRI